MQAAWLSECMKEGHEWRGRAAVAGAYGRCWAQKRQFFSKMEIRKYGDLALFTKSVEQALAIGEATRYHKIYHGGTFTLNTPAGRRLFGRSFKEATLNLFLFLHRLICLFPFDLAL